MVVANDKYNLLYKFKKNEVGSGLHAVYLAQTYQTLFNAVDYEHEEVPQQNRIWLLHKPTFYKYRLVDRSNDINCVRMEHIRQVIGMKVTNGYSYFRKYRSYFDQWFPTIYDSNFGVNSVPSIGYYARDMRQQSNRAFIDFVQALPVGVPIVTMGTKELIESKIPSGSNWRHTYSNEDFWRSCSHYFYYQPSDFEDPFPHTLLEAIQSGHRIISYKDINRTFYDGVDDLLSCIEYDAKFMSENKGKKYEMLTSTTWKHYIRDVVESKFAIKPDVLNHGFLYDWICKKIR